MADTFIAVPDLLSLLELASNAEYRFAVLHATAPGRSGLVETSATEELLGAYTIHEGLVAALTPFSTTPAVRLS